MVRLAKFNENHFIDSAIEIASQCGYAAVSMSAIALKAGAPIGSVYHRFESRSAILARAWLRVKADFRCEVASLWGRSDGDTWAGVNGLLDWCRRKPVYARFLLHCEDHPDFNGAHGAHGGLSADLMAALEAEQAELDACFERCISAMAGQGDHLSSSLRFMLIDAPVAIVKPYLSQNLPIPASADAMLRATHDAVRGWATQTTDTPH